MASTTSEFSPIVMAPPIVMSAKTLKMKSNAPQEDEDLQYVSDQDSLPAKRRQSQASDILYDKTDSDVEEDIRAQEPQDELDQSDDTLPAKTSKARAAKSSNATKSTAAAKATKKPSASEEEEMQQSASDQDSQEEPPAKISRAKSSKAASKSATAAKPKAKSTRKTKNASASEEEEMQQSASDQDSQEEEPPAKTARARAAKSPTAASKSTAAAKPKAKPTRKTKKSTVSDEEETQQSASDQDDFDEKPAKNSKTKSRAVAKPKSTTAANPRTARKTKKATAIENEEAERSGVDIKDDSDASGDYHEKTGDIPFDFQSAKSSRAKCKGNSCKVKKILQGTIKFCVLKGKQVVGFHVECVSEDQKARVRQWVGGFGDLEGYDLLDSDECSHLKHL